MLSKINLKKENISADLVIWIINKHCLEIPLTARVCLIFFFDHHLSYRLLNVLYLMPWKGWNEVNINQRYMYIHLVVVVQYTFQPIWLVFSLLIFH